MKKQIFELVKCWKHNEKEGRNLNEKSAKRESLHYLVIQKIFEKIKMDKKEYVKENAKFENVSSGRTYLKNESGVSLITLVITIIVVIILAAIALRKRRKRFNRISKLCKICK